MEAQKIYFLIEKTDECFHLKNVFQMENVRIEFELSGQTAIISPDMGSIIVFEQKLDRRINFIPIENGVYAFSFTKDNPVIAQDMLWEEFQFIYNRLLKNGYKPCYFDYPQWFEKYNHHYKKYQLIY